MDEEKIEDQLIDKFIRRLKKIRDKMDVDYKLTTYDTNIILEEVGHEMRMRMISEERGERGQQTILPNGKITPTENQIKFINNMRQQTEELPISQKEIDAMDSVDKINKEIERLKKKRATQ